MTDRQLDYEDMETLLMYDREKILHDALKAILSACAVAEKRPYRRQGGLAHEISLIASKALACGEEWRQSVARAASESAAELIP